jgi:hypothetical protein
MRKFSDLGYPTYVMSVERLWKAVIILIDSVLLTNATKIRIVEKESEKEI